MKTEDFNKACELTERINSLNMYRGYIKSIIEYKPFRAKLTYSVLNNETTQHFNFGNELINNATANPEDMQVILSAIDTQILKLENEFEELGEKKSEIISRSEYGANEQKIYDESKNKTSMLKRKFKRSNLAKGFDNGRFKDGTVVMLWDFVSETPYFEIWKCYPDGINTLYEMRIPKEFI